MTPHEQLRERRLLHPVPARIQGNLFHFDMNLDYKLRGRVLNWIETHTEGQFYLGPNTLYFLSDKDAMVYRLFDVREKCKEVS